MDESYKIFEERVLYALIEALRQGKNHKVIQHIY